MSNPYANLSTEELKRMRDEIKKAQNPYANLSTEELKKMRDELRAQQQEEVQPHQEPTFLDRFKQLGKGALNGAYETAKFFQPEPTSSDPFLFPFERMTPSFEDPEKVKETYSQYEQQHADELKNTDPLGRIVNNAGSFAGAMAAPIPGGAIGNIAKQGYRALRHKAPIKFAEIAEKFVPKTITSESLKNVAKTGVGGASLGAVSGTAQEMGANPLAADIGTIAGAPLVANIAKKIPKAAKLAFSEEARVAAREEKLAQGIAKKFTEKENVTPESINVEHNLKPFNKRGDIEETGTLVKKQISDKFENLKKIRSEKTKPLYDEARKNTDLIFPKNLLNYIDEELPHLTGSIKNDFNKFRKEILGENFSSNSNAISKRDKDLGITKKTHPEWAKYLRGNASFGPPEGARLAKLDSLNKEIGDQIAKAKLMGQNGKAHTLSEAKSFLEKDLLEHPLGSKRHQAYKENSSEINEIEKSILGKMIKSKDAYGIEEIIKDENVLGKFLKGMGAKNSASKLKKIIGNDKKINESIQNSINEDFLTKITNHKDQYSPSSINSYIKNNPGAEILYPGFKEKALKLAESQNLSNQLRKESQSSAFLKNNPASSFAGKISKSFARNLPFGDKVWDIMASASKEQRKETISNIVESILSDTEKAEKIFKNSSPPKKNLFEDFGKYNKGAIPSLAKKKESDSKK